MHGQPHIRCALQFKFKRPTPSTSAATQYPRTDTYFSAAPPLLLQRLRQPTHRLRLMGPIHGQTVCATQAIAQTVWSCVLWFGCLGNSLTIFKQVLILLRNNQIAQQSDACMDMFASCCTTSPVQHWFAYRSHLLLKMSQNVTTANKEFWREFIVISVATVIMEI